MLTLTDFIFVYHSNIKKGYCMDTFVLKIKRYVFEEIFISTIET